MAYGHRQRSRGLASAALRCGLAVGVAFLAGGCTLLFPSLRPTQGAQRNLFCALEYRPDPNRPGEPDLLFLAGGQPYKLEEVDMSLPDGLLHTVVAPGRHLSAPVHLLGVTCEPPLWGEGHRLPGHLSLHHYMLCRRQGLARVEIEVRTKWGSCRREIPEGDATPHCREWFERSSRGLARLSPAVCPSLPQPTYESRRGRTPMGGSWVVIREGSGPRVAPETSIVFHETVVTRGFVVASSSHFDGAPRRAVVGGEGLPAWVAEAVVGMRVGERRRVHEPLTVAQESLGSGRPEADEPLYYDLEVLAVEPESEETLP